MGNSAVRETSDRQWRAALVLSYRSVASRPRLPAIADVWRGNVLFVALDRLLVAAGPHSRVTSPPSMRDWPDAFGRMGLWPNTRVRAQSPFAPGLVTMPMADEEMQPLMDAQQGISLEQAYQRVATRPASPPGQRGDCARLPVPLFVLAGVDYQR